MPRWSPNGRYLAVLAVNSQGMKLFDFQTHKWTALTNKTVGYPSWSVNREYMYFLRVRSSPDVFRVQIRDRKTEPVVSPKDYEMTGYYDIRFGLAPDNSPLLLKDTGTQDIVSMDWNAGGPRTTYLQDDSASLSPASHIPGFGACVMAKMALSRERPTNS